MPSGAKKKKSSKRKNHKMTIDDHEQGNGKEKRSVVIEDEGDETFETPRFQPEMSSYSTEKLKIGRIDEVERSRIEPETPYYSMENMEIGKKDDEPEGSREVDVPAGEKLKNLVVENLRETNLGESENSNAFENGEEAQKEGEFLKERKLDEAVCISEEESSAGMDVKLEKSEKSVSFDEEKTPVASTEAIDTSSSNEKELKVVPWLDEEVAAINGDVNGDAEIVASKKQSDGDESKQHIPATENSKDAAESVQTLPQIKTELINNKLNNFVAKSSLPVESSVLTTKEANCGSKAPEGSPENSVGVSYLLSHGRTKEAADPSFDGEKIDISERKEIARDLPVVRRASIWNCCGLFEVLTSNVR